MKICPWLAAPIFALASSAQAAGPMTLLDATYALAIDSRLGRIEVCGLNFELLALNSEGAAFLVGGSANLTFSAGGLPLLITKIEAFASFGGSVGPLSIELFYIRVGSLNTLDFVSSRGEDGFSRISAVSLFDSVEYVALIDHLLRSGGQLGFNTGDQRDHTVTLPAASDRTLSQQMNECAEAGLDQLRREAGGGP